MLFKAAVGVVRLFVSRFCRVLTVWCHHPACLCARKPEGACLKYNTGSHSKDAHRPLILRAIVWNILRRGQKHKNKDEEHNKHFGNNDWNVPNVNVRKMKTYLKLFKISCIFFLKGKAHWPWIRKVLFSAQSIFFTFFVLFFPIWAAHYIYKLRGDTADKTFFFFFYIFKFWPSMFSWHVNLQYLIFTIRW